VLTVEYFIRARLKENFIVINSLSISKAHIPRRRPIIGGWWVQDYISRQMKTNCLTAEHVQETHSRLVKSPRKILRSMTHQSQASYQLNFARTKKGVICMVILWGGG
jgi:hypothetical protein